MVAVNQAFEAIKRSNFVPEEYKSLSDEDMPLPIGYGQTISQPTTVRLMLEWLDAGPGQKILDVGSGSGWTTALLSCIAGTRGRVYAVERIPELVEMSQENCERIGIKNASFHTARPVYGLPGFAPYDRILVSASADHLPEELISQLKPKGKLVIPVHNDILEIFNDEKPRIKRHHGFVFVPLI